MQCQSSVNVASAGLRVAPGSNLPEEKGGSRSPSRRRRENTGPEADTVPQREGRSTSKPLPKKPQSSNLETPTEDKVNELGDLRFPSPLGFHRRVPSQKDWSSCLDAVLGELMTSTQSPAASPKRRRAAARSDSIPQLPPHTQDSGYLPSGMAMEEKLCRGRAAVDSVSPQKERPQGATSRQQMVSAKALLTAQPEAVFSGPSPPLPAGHSRFSSNSKGRIDLAATLRLEDMDDEAGAGAPKTSGDSPCGWQPPVGFRNPQDGRSMLPGHQRQGGLAFSSHQHLASTIRLEDLEDARSGLSSRASLRGDAWHGVATGAAASCPRSPGMQQSSSSPLLHGGSARPVVGPHPSLRPGTSSGASLRLAGNQLAGGRAHGAQLCVPDFGRPALF